MKQVYVWGTGVVLARILDYWIKRDEIIAFIDNDENKRVYIGKKVIHPSEIAEKYDAIIVANSHTQEIIKQSLELGLDIKKMIFLYNNISTNDINRDYSFVSDILGEHYAKIVKERYHLVRNIAKDEVIEQTRDLSQIPMYKDDYVRIKTLELVADEINERNIEGATAELGVFRGEFSRCINSVFRNRKLYLFDTFDGFDSSEADLEKSNGSCNDAFINAFKNVNVGKVLNKMEYPENVIVQQGFFPETAEGLEEKFVFVSLDADFEETTLKGLEYFYPRLVRGGYIFIHDYNYGYFDCIKKAVSRFEKKNELCLCKVPIPDAIGTLVITK
ncbi:MAG: macrocin O-methyltransferase [Lachnospiraceae bacterium]|nr:macrocin O-methyltransferase [Lachnospiraceae bacterium]